MDQAGAPTAAHDLAGHPRLPPRSTEQIAFQDAVIADISRSLLGRWWAALRLGIAKLVRRSQPVPVWAVILCVALITLALSASLAEALGETAILQFEPFGKLTLWVGFTALFVGVMQSQLNASVYLLNTTVLESLATDQEINTLRHFFARALHWRWQLIFCVAYSISIALLSTYSIFYLAGEGFPISATVLYTINFFQIAMYILFLGIFSAVFLRLRTMNIRMYQGDPSASPVIQHLYRSSSRLMFAIAFLTALFDFLVVYLHRHIPNNYPILLWAPHFMIGWAPILILFIVTHSALSGMIIRSKTAKLAALQSLIDRTERDSNMADKATIENITRLMDYHDRIKAYPNSLVDARAVINLITSLLLPLLGAVLGGISAIIDLWHKLALP